MLVLSEAAPPPALSVESAMTLGRLPVLASAWSRAWSSGTTGGANRPLSVRNSSPSLVASASPAALALSVITRTRRADLGHVALLETMGERDREHAFLAFERAHAVDEGAAGLARRRHQLDHPAIIERHHRPDLAADGPDDDGDEFLGALDEIDMRVFLVEDDGVCEPHPLLGQVAMRIEFDADRHLRPDQSADMLEDVALAIVIAMRHHRAVQAEQHAVDRQGRLELPEDLVAHLLVIGLAQVPEGSAQKHEPSISVNPSCFARCRAT